RLAVLGDVAAFRALGRDVDARRRVEPALLVGLAGVAAAADDRVQLHLRLDERGELARGRDEDTRGAGGAEGGRVAAREVDGVVARELGPGERVVLARDELVTKERDRALAGVVHVGDGAALRFGANRGLDAHAVR